MIWYQSKHPAPVFKLEFDNPIKHIETGANLSIQASSTMVIDTAYILEALHFVEFGFLYLLWVMAFLTYGRLTNVLDLAAVVIAVLYGMVDEIHQYFVPYRSATWNDLIKDTIGVIVAWYLVHRTYFVHYNSRIGTFSRGITMFLSNQKARNVRKGARQARL
jgi:hypothetical protein